MEASLDHSLCQELAFLVEKLTTTGQQILDQDNLKTFKKICKKSDEYVEYAYHQIMMQLEEQHAEIRFSAFQLVNELFCRSHAFRTLLLADFQTYIELTMESNPDNPLPPPKATAKNLRSKALEAIHQWNGKYGRDYKKLSLGYNYLKGCKKMDFVGMEVRTAAEQRQAEEQQRRQDMMRAQRLDSCLKEITDTSPDIKDVLVQIENGLRLVLPDPESFQIHGLMSPEHSISYHNPFFAYAKRTPASIGQHRSSNTSRKSVEKSAKTRRSSNTPKQEILTCNPGVKKENKAHTHPEEANSSISNNSDGICIKMEPQGDVESVSETPAGNATPNVDQSYTDHQLMEDRSDSSYTQAKDGRAIAPNREIKTEQENGKKPAIDNNKSADSHKTLRQCTEDEGEDSEDDFQEISTGTSDDEDEEDDEGGEVLREADVVRHHGLGSQQYQLSIEIDTGEYRLEETVDNTDILHNLRELIRQMSTKMLPKVQRWLEVLSKAGADQSQIRRVIDIKNAIETAKTRIQKLKIIPMPTTQSGLTEKCKSEPGKDDDEEDSDFEDVPEKEGYEARVPDHLREEYGLVEKAPKPSTSKDWSFKTVRENRDDASDPTTPHATIIQLIKQQQKARHSPKTSQLTTDLPVDKDQSGCQASAATPGAKGKSAARGKGKGKMIKEEVPVVPFGTDLLHWGEDKIEMPLVVMYESEHKFWNNKFDGQDVVDVNALESMKSRVINFTGKFQPVQWSCRAPLRNGTLCPRMDRVKCPFHGKIIPRDNMGQPSNPEDRERLAEEEAKRRLLGPAEWDDPVFQAEIVAATGVDLNPGKNQRKGKKKEKYPGLTNLNQKKDRARSRLEKRVLNPQALKRVANAVNAISMKKFKDKFGNSFNYTFAK